MSENPYKSAETETPTPSGKRPLFTPAGVILGLVAIGITVALLLPSVRTARPATYRNMCLNNTKQIMLALLNYEAEHGTLPPAYSVDAEGNRLHSWRALILPYIEGNTTHKLIDFTKPWDDPANAAAREVVMEVYLCPSAPYEDEHLTTYLAIVGAEASITGPDGRSLGDVPGGHSHTIAVIDAPHDKAVHWMSPHDITIDEVLAFDEQTRAQHRYVFIAGYLDGSAEGVDLDIERDVLRSMLTVADDTPAHLKPQ